MSTISLVKHRPVCGSSRTHKPNAVVHLPVCPQMVARTRFSPPTPLQSHCLLIPEAIELLRQEIEKRKGKVTMVALSGPGDPLATPEITLYAIQEILKQFPGLSIGLRTLGMNSKELAPDLAQAGVEYVELQVDGVRTEILEKLYAWIRPGQKTLKISEAAKMLIKEQLGGVAALKFHDITVSISSTLYPGYNIDHLPKLCAEMMEVGADSISLLPYIPEPGTEVDLAVPTADAFEQTCRKVEKYLPVVQPLLATQTDKADGTEKDTKPPLPKPTKEKPNVAVASSNGIEIDLHLGQAVNFLIYGPREDGLPCLLGTRQAPEPGSGKERWSKVASVLEDCFVLLTASAGESPRKQLGEAGIRVLIKEDNIEGMVDVLYGGGKKGKKKKKAM